MVMVKHKEQKMIKLNRKLAVGGDGDWSEKEAIVTITGIDYNGHTVDLFFDTNDWDTYEDGLIYTDSVFFKEACALFNNLGLSDDIYYSEQGMQGDDYVNLDVGPGFARTWKAFVKSKSKELVYG
jgi:hypothetical protein